jgi:hypothetical protein
LVWLDADSLFWQLNAICNIYPIIAAGFLDGSDEAMVCVHSERTSFLNVKLTRHLTIVKVTNGMHGQLPPLEFERDFVDEDCSSPVIRHAGFPEMSSHHPGKPEYVVLVGKDWYVNIS